jgi:hypothetical protein
MYLIDTEDQWRESEAIRHLLGNPLHQEHVLGPMGLGTLSWIMMEVDNSLLLPSIVGEVDILAGPLEFRAPEDFQEALKRRKTENPDSHPSWPELFAAKEVSEAGGILWPPRVSYVIGVEVKCAYFSDRLHSAKDSNSHVRRIRKQLDRLKSMGVDRMALLDVIANPPSQGLNSNPWFEAASRADHSLRAMKDILQARLPAETPSGHFVWSAGAVVGGDESVRGAGVPEMIRPPMVNPSLAAGDPQVLASRELLRGRISRTLGSLPQPIYFPAMFVGCRACKKMRAFHDPVCDCGGWLASNEAARS